MDKMNAAVARYLIARGSTVHLVGHRFADEFVNDSAVRLHRVARLAGSFFLSERGLDRKGRSVAARLSVHDAATRLLVNGVNCGRSGLDWVHFLCHAEPRRRGGPLWLRVKNRLEAIQVKRRERKVLPRAQLLIANSERTRRDLLDLPGIGDAPIFTIYPGVDVSFQPPPTAQRAQARHWLGLGDEPVVAFVGGLRHDHHKGFDTLWRAWFELSARPDWNATMVVAGGGRMLAEWRERAARAGWSRRVIFLGHTSRVAEVLAASDLLVSPTRYEPYGLAVHEAIASGVPAMVSASAGIGERYPAELRDMLIPDAEDAEDLFRRLLEWGRNVDGVKLRFESFGATLRAYTEVDMASRIVELGSAVPLGKSG